MSIPAAHASLWMPLPAGQKGIALAVWSLNVALFSTFLCLLLSRALCYPASARELLEQPNQSLFFGALPMSISVVTGGVATLLVPRWVYYRPSRKSSSSTRQQQPK
jgi:tellurite resistance protein TehA-like permease